MTDRGNDRAVLPDSAWNGSRVHGWLGLRRAANFWRLRRFTDEGVTVTYYATRRGGVVVLSVEGVTT